MLSAAYTATKTRPLPFRLQGDRIAPSHLPANSLAGSRRRCCRTFCSSCPNRQPHYCGQPRRTIPAALSSIGPGKIRSSRCACRRPALRRQLCHALARTGPQRRSRHRASAGHADRHRHAQARRLRRRRRHRRQRRPRLRRAGQLRPRRRLLRLRLGSQGRQAGRHGQLRPLAQSAHA